MLSRWDHLVILIKKLSDDFFLSGLSSSVLKNETFKKLKEKTKCTEHIYIHMYVSVSIVVDGGRDVRVWCKCASERAMLSVLVRTILSTRVCCMFFLICLTDLSTWMSWVCDTKSYDVRSIACLQIMWQVQALILVVCLKISLFLLSLSLSLCLSPTLALCLSSLSHSLSLCVCVCVCVCVPCMNTRKWAAKKGQVAGDVCWRETSNYVESSSNNLSMLTYPDVYWRILTYPDVSWRMLTYADVPWRMNNEEEEGWGRWWRWL